MARPLKRWVSQYILHTGAGRIVSTWRRHRALVLAYHNVVPDHAPPAGEAGLHLPRRTFAAQLDALMRTHDVVPLPALLEPRRHAKRPLAAITFDDAYRGTLTVALQELVARGLPATFFIAPQLLGARRFWWDELASPDADQGVAPAVRHHALHALAGRGADIRTWAARQGLPVQSLPLPAQSATEAELTVAAQADGVTLAAHSWSHPNLAAISAAELREELIRPLAWLRQRYRNVIPWISYPYGLTSAQTLQAAQQAGYVAGLRAGGGWMRRGDHRYALPRFCITREMSDTYVRLRFAGIR